MSRVRSLALALVLALSADAWADRKGARPAKLKGIKTRAVEAETAAPTPEAPADRKPKELDFSRATAPTGDERVAEKRRQLIKDLDALLAKAGPKYAARPDRLHQKAELEWEEARYLHHLALEKHHESAADTPEPRPDYKAPVATWERILADHPDYPAADEIRYHLGFALADAGEDVAAIEVLEELLKKHPRSSFVPDARVALGELFFGRDMPDDAAIHFAEVVKKTPTHPLAPFARYKLGWALYRMQRYDEAVTELVAAVEDDEKRGGKMTVREQAFADLIVVWAERAGGWKDAAAYYEKKGGEKMLRAELLRFAKWLASQGKAEDAIALCEWLVARDPRHPAVVEYERIRWGIVERGRKPEVAEAAIERLRRVAETHAKDGGALLEHALLWTATLRHETAQRTSHAPSYLAAAKLYDEAVTRFVGSPRHGETVFRLAEVRYQLGDTLAAAKAYMRAASLIRGEVGDEAAYKAVYAAADAVKAAGLADDAACPADEPNAPPPPEIPLNDAERTLVEAADRYVARVPASPDAAEIRFLAARVLWLRLHATEAAGRFQAIVDAYPKSPVAGDAAALALDALARARRTPEVVAWARRMIAEKRFDQLDEKQLREVVSSASAQAAVELEQRGDRAGAARVLVGIVDDNPRSPRAPERLWQAATLLLAAGDRAGAEKLYERILDRHADSDAGERAAFALAGVYAARGHLSRAAAAYEASGKNHDAVYNAAILREILGEHDKAVALYLKYAERGAQDAQATVLRAGEVLERAGRRDDAIALYRGFGKKFGKKAHPALALEAEARICALTSDAKKAKKLCGAVLGGVRKVGGPAAPAAARAQLHLAELEAAAMDAVSLDDIDRKTAALARTVDAYLSVTQYAVPEFGARAVVGLGAAYQRFAAALRAAPEPRDLTGADLETWRQTLDETASKFEEDAIEAFARITDLAAAGALGDATSAAAAARRKIDPVSDPWLGGDPARPVVHPKPLRLTLDAAIVLAAAGGADAGHRVVEEALAAQDDDPRAWTALSRMFLVEGKPAAARWAGQLAMTRALSPWTVLAVADANLAEGDPAAAAAALEMARKKWPDDRDVNVRLGMLRLEHGDARGAVEPLRAAHDARPDQEVGLALAAALRLSRDAEGARAVLAKLGPDDPRVARALKEVSEE